MVAAMHAELLERIEAYRHKHLLEETIVGIALCGDPWLVRDLKEGKRKFRLRTLDRIDRALKKPPKTNSVTKRAS